jgi:hypothetical protein
MYCYVRPHMCVDSASGNVNSHCCVGFINPIGVVAGVRRQRLDLCIGST